jgi:mannose-6-phosphate isomerase-like protein (cupin superfamily)
MRFAPGWNSTVGHRHPGGEEVYVLVEGRARIKIDDDVFVMDAPSAVRVRADQFRAIRASGGDAAVFVVAGWPIEDPRATEFAPGFWPES